MNSTSAIQLVTAVLGGLLGIASSVIPVIVNRTGWIRRAKALCDLYAALPSRHRTPEDRFAIYLLEREICKAVTNGLGYVDVEGIPTYKAPLKAWLPHLLLCSGALYAASAFVAWHAGGMTRVLTVSIAFLVGTALGMPLDLFLREHPKAPWNPHYQARIEEEEYRNRMAAVFAIMELNPEMDFLTACAESTKYEVQRKDEDSAQPCQKGK